MTPVHPQVALAANFHDMGQYSDEVGWDLDFRQIESGPLNAGVKAVTMAFGMILNVDFNRKFHQVGCPPKRVADLRYPQRRCRYFHVVCGQRPWWGAT